MEMYRKILVVFMLCFVIAGCASSQSKKEEDLQISKLDLINYSWWFKFNDNNLNEYILTALKNNHDLKIALLKLEEYNQFVKASFGSELPAVTTSLNAFKIDKSPIPSSLMKDNGLVLPLTLNYEADIFLKNRDKTKALKKQFEAYEYQVQSTYIALVSNLATVYFNIVKINEMISLTERLIDIRKNILIDMTDRYMSGLVSEIDLNSARKDINSMEINLSELKKNKVNLMTQFCVLIGKNPSEFEDLKITDYSAIHMRPTYTSVSSDVIFSRPDVLAFEKQMEKADIDIRVARKEFLPTISLSGSLNWSTLASGGFFDSKNTIGMLLAGVSGELFTGGRKVANLKIMKSRYEQMFENYKKVTLEAIKEVNDSMYAVQFNSEISADTYNKYSAEKNTFNHYNRMFKNGIISQIDLKKSEQNLISAEMDLVSSKIQDYIGFISLYKATGGKI